MIANMAQVLQQIEEVKQKKIDQAIVEIVKYIARMTFFYASSDYRMTGGEYGSPTKRGVFYSNHMMSVGFPSGAKRVKEIDKRGDKERYAASGPDYGPLGLSVADDALSRFTAIGVPIYITNNTSYAVKIENEGWSKKTPRGVYNIAASMIGVRLKYENWNNVIPNLR